MPLAADAPRPVPIPAADVLFVETLRSGLAAYIRGDYRRASERFGDAAAVAGYRPDAVAWANLSHVLELTQVDRTLVSRDAAYVDDVEAPQ